MKVRNIGKRLILCQGGELPPGAVLNLTDVLAFDLQGQFPGELELEKEVEKETPPKPTSKVKPTKGA